MPLIETKGAASAQGFGGAGAGASGPVTYIEDVFSTYLYTGNGSTQTITNGIDLAGKGGLVWLKSRSSPNWRHCLFDTQRGVLNRISSNNTDAQQTVSYSLTSFNSNGFSLDGAYNENEPGTTYASWTFRKQPKFFDVVTYTGNGSAGRTISHNLGSYPGCIIVKKTSAADNWLVWHRSLSSPTTSSSGLMWLNATNAEFTGVGSIYVPSGNTTTFTVASGSDVNQSGATYVAYLFAHNAGGFGLTGTDNVISCGSYTGNGLTDGPVINFSYEPQWVMIKRTDSTGNWALIDIMRGFPNTGSAGNYDNGLLANTSGAETTTSLRVKPTSTGFSPVGGDSDTNASGGTYIYIAIRRGPMKVPTSGASVFSPQVWTGNGANRTITDDGIPPDVFIAGQRTSPYPDGPTWWNKLAGQDKYLISSSTAAEQPTGDSLNTASNAFLQNGIALGANVNQSNTNYATSSTYVGWFMRRAPGFFDVVCYTGTGATQNVTHNLGAAPELMILKRRDGVSNWATYAAPLGNTKGFDGPNTNGAAYTSSLAWNNTTPTSSVFTVGTANSTNQNAATYVAYLFATCAGVSKVGSYTGTGALQTVNCGFTGGARFVLIKRTDSTGDWYVYDSARGISSGNDPYLLLNSTAAEVTGTNYVDTTSVGFQVTAAAPAGLNANGGSFVFLAIA